MKDRVIAFVSLTVAVAALAYAAWVHICAEQMAMDALRKREVEVVAFWTPTVTKMSVDMLGTNALPAVPRTFEDLSRPIIQVLNGLGEISSEPVTDAAQP